MKQIMIITGMLCGIVDGRTIYRKSDPDMPKIIAQWPDESHQYLLSDWHLEESAIFQKFNKDFFYQHYLPMGKISYRNKPNQSVKGSLLDRLINKFIDEIIETQKHGRVFSDFFILKDCDYNYRAHSGLIIARFKNYPFVIKLFMENPESFVEPFSKGVEPCCFFMMGGGINRYLSGFTRIKNLENIVNHINQNSYWSKLIDVPRKWFWEPRNNKWFQVRGYNFGGYACALKQILLPSIYGLICDFIETEGSLSLWKSSHREQAMQLSKFLGNRIDAHIFNFMIEKNTGAIVIVDTEHFPSMVGLRSPITYDSYPSWYYQLIKKCMYDTFLRSKQKSRDIQCHRYPPIMEV